MPINCRKLEVCFFVCPYVALLRCNYSLINAFDQTLNSRTSKTLQDTAVEISTAVSCCSRTTHAWIICSKRGQFNFVAKAHVTQQQEACIVSAALGQACCSAYKFGDGDSRQCEFAWGLRQRLRNSCCTTVLQRGAHGPTTTTCRQNESSQHKLHRSFTKLHWSFTKALSHKR